MLLTLSKFGMPLLETSAQSPSSSLDASFSFHVGSVTTIISHDVHSQGWWDSSDMAGPKQRPASSLQTSLPVLAALLLEDGKQDVGLPEVHLPSQWPRSDRNGDSRTHARPAFTDNELAKTLKRDLKWEPDFLTMHELESSKKPAVNIEVRQTNMFS